MRWAGEDSNHRLLPPSRLRDLCRAAYDGRVSRPSRGATLLIGTVTACSVFAWASVASGHEASDLQEASTLGAPRASEPPLEATPQAECGPGSRPETGLQGRVSPEDHASDHAAEGFTCNTELVGSYTHPSPLGTVGGYRVHRYVDAAGHECAFYDSTLLFPTTAADQEAGINVLDMSDPSHPVLTDTLTSPAMISPHESLSFNERRGLLVAVSGNPAFLPGIVDVYDASEDCRHPVLKSSSPTGIFGHEGNIAPDGRTFYSASPGTATIVAVDISNPSLPVPIATGDYDSHGLTISDDGNRAYVGGINDGLLILDTSEVQAREPNPDIRLISSLTWTSMSIPQTAIPITIDGHPYVVEIDEFHDDGVSTTGPVGAGRIIDIADETQPQVISNLRLEVHQPENFETISNDPGTESPLQGYAGHYCNVPTRVDPEIVACSMILSGLRIFDIRDPYHPREVAYFNAPVLPRTISDPSNYAMSAPAFAPGRHEVWYTDGFSGFYAVRLTNDVWNPGACNQVRGTRHKDRLRGTNEDDCLRGRGGPDKISGRGGDDTERGGRGRDRLRGGSGDDVIRAARGSRDRVNCGPGDDEVFVSESRDRWRHCETVHRRS